jgi:EAL domain-containing protein (putative c-di-GMP-specific phosphodiesterase class I)
MKSTKATTERLPASQEYLMLDYAQRVGRFREGRRAVHVHLSRLRPHNRRDHHIRIAINTFESLVRQFECQIFHLANADIVFVCKDAKLATVDEAVQKLRYLFGEDPLTQGGTDEDGADRFCTWYDFEHDYDSFYVMAQSACEEEQKRLRRLATIAGGENKAAASPQAGLDAPRLAEIVGLIQRADLSNMLRRQAVCAITRGTAPTPILREVYVSIPELRDSVMPGYDLASDRWLFQHLTQALDRRMMKMLARADDSALASAISINLNVSTLVSDAFLEFDANIKSSARGSIMIELQLIDIFADMAAYQFARDFARERGYRICLDGVTHLTLPYIDREKLGLDFVKVLWRSDILDSQEPQRANEFRAKIEELNRTRVILCRCDNEEAVKVGQSWGIALFQGRYVDRLLVQLQKAGSGTVNARTVR